MAEQGMVTIETIAALTPAQQEVLGQICINEDQMHNKRVIQALLGKGLIESYVEIDRGRSGRELPMRITHYRTPPHVHMAWAAWCSTMFPDE